MSRQDFEALLSRHSDKPKQPSIDWAQQKQEWLDFIDQFYDSIEAWVKPFRSRGELTYRFDTITLTEEHIGTYQAKTMSMDFADQEIIFEPIGTLLIGTKGRIDMEGARGRVQFILADKDSTGLNISVSTTADDDETPDRHEQIGKQPIWTWKIVTRQPHTISYAEFNENNFFDALMEVVNG